MEFIFENDDSQTDDVNDNFSVVSASSIDQTPMITADDDFQLPGEPVSAPAPKPVRKKATRARKSVAVSPNDVEFAEPKRTRKRAQGPKVNYVKSVKKKSAARKKKFEWTWVKVGWMLCGALMLRLVFMEAGIIDFYSMENTLKNKEHDLQLVRQENAELIQEIHKIKTSTKYQKKLVREHLGVIARGEYLVLFGKESSTNSF